MEGNDAAVEENRRNPKNRFLGLFCHASDVDDHWGFNWSFKCGVFVFSILIGAGTIFDAASLSKVMRRITTGWFIFWCIVRFFSDLIAIIAIIVALMSIFQSDFRKATTAYYLLMLSLVFNTAFIIYCIVSVFSASFWRSTGFRLIIWMLNEFVILIFDWILFCNMVDIGRKNRQAMASNPF